MGDIERWFVRDPLDDHHRVVSSEAAAGNYRRMGWTVEGPFVPGYAYQGAVEAERQRIVSFVRDKAEGTWDPNLEAVLRDVARQIANHDAFRENRLPTEDR